MAVIMQNLVKTTITLPQELLQRAKFIAVYERTTVSELVRDALKSRVNGGQKKQVVKDPMKLLGKYKLGTRGKLYEHRSDLYEERLRRKLGI